MHKELITYGQAASYLGLKKGTLYAMVSRRQIPHVRLGPRLVRFDAEELRGWVEARRVSPRVVTNSDTTVGGDGLHP